MNNTEQNIENYLCKFLNTKKNKSNIFFSSQVKEKSVYEIFQKKIEQDTTVWIDLCYDFKK